MGSAVRFVRVMMDTYRSVVTSEPNAILIPTLALIRCHECIVSLCRRVYLSIADKGTACPVHVYAMPGGKMLIVIVFKASQRMCA